MAQHKAHLIEFSLKINENGKISGKSLKFSGISTVVCGAKQMNGNTPNMLSKNDIQNFLKLPKEIMCIKCREILKSRIAELKK